MNAVADAKAQASATKDRFVKAIELVLSARIAVAAAATLALAFGTQLIYAPGRAPPLGGLSLAQLGLLPPLDLGQAGDMLQEAGAAAQRQGAGGAIAGFFAEHPAFVPWANGLGLALALGLLGWTMWLQMRAYARARHAVTYYDGLAHTQRRAP